MTPPKPEVIFDLEAYAVHKYPKKGKCARSCFANGNHRVGTVPIFSALDDALPGDVIREVCLECRWWFKNDGFVVINQPSSIGGFR